jgi:hypothetical protein
VASFAEVNQALLAHSEDWDSTVQQLGLTTAAVEDMAQNVLTHVTEQSRAYWSWAWWCLG